jgi:hypothetical protein
MCCIRCGPWGWQLGIQFSTGGAVDGTIDWTVGGVVAVAFESAVSAAADALAFGCERP